MTLNKEVCIQLNILSMMWEGFVGWQGMAGVDRWNREEDLVPEEVEDTQESERVESSPSQEHVRTQRGLLGGKGKG